MRGACGSLAVGACFGGRGKVTLGLVFGVLMFAFSLFAAPLDTPIVFVSRSFDKFPAPSERSNAIQRSLRGTLRVLEPDGSVRTLVDARATNAVADTPIDVGSPSVSYDGTHIVFSGLSSVDNAWRIYEVGADGSGLRKITQSDRHIDLSGYGDSARLFKTYDDWDPIYLPDGRICCVSTRTPGLAPGGRVRATNLYVVNSTGSDMHRITSERFGGDTPVVDPRTGRVVYSRWWMTTPSEMPITTRAKSRLRSGESMLPGYGRPPSSPPPAQSPSNPQPTPVPDPPPVPDDNSILRGIPSANFEGVNNWFLSTVRPDGADDSMLAGFGIDRNLTMAWQPTFLPTGEMAYLFITTPPFLGNPTESGLRVTVPGSFLPRPLGGPQSFDRTANFPDPRTSFIEQPVEEPAFFYSSVEAMADGRLLVTGFPGSERPQQFIDPEDPDVVPPVIDRDIFVQSNEFGEPVPVYGTDESMELDAVPLTTRVRPPVIEDTAPRLDYDEGAADVATAIARNGSFRFLVENIFMNAELDSAIATAPPISGNLTIQFFMNPQRDGGLIPAEPVLVAEQEIPPHGRVDQTLPAGVPLFERLVLPDGQIALGRDGQIFHVGGMNFGIDGAVSTCVGCHAGHSQMEVPPDPSRMNLAPSAMTSATSSATEIGGRAIASLASNVVDRSTRAVVSEWIAERDDPIPSVSVVWDVPIHADEVVVYAPRLGGGPLGRRSLVVRDFIVETFLGGEVVHQRSNNGPLFGGGNRIGLEDRFAFDTLTVTITEGGGRIGGVEYGGGIAEIEVFGSVAKASRSFVNLTRGDTDCDGEFSINDTLQIARHIIVNTSLCCQEAADVDMSGVVDLTDVLRHAGWLLLGSAPPAQPFPNCNRVPSGGHSCKLSECP